MSTCNSCNKCNNLHLLLMFQEFMGDHGRAGFRSGISTYNGQASLVSNCLLKQTQRIQQISNVISKNPR
jgi:hypothetical protein